MGDDWPDLPVMRRCAFSCAPPQCPCEEVGPAALRDRLRGGEGAAREFCDLLLVASGRYVDLLLKSTRNDADCWDVWDRFLLYFPLVSMGLLALGTYWLVRSTPVPPSGGRGRVLPVTSRTTS
jgi:hypothetical protein